LTKPNFEQEDLRLAAASPACEKDACVSDLGGVARALIQGGRFVIVTHMDPDGDGIGSMLALGEVLKSAGKEAVLLTTEPIGLPYSLFHGAERIVQYLQPGSPFDAALVLDCGELSRLDGLRGSIRHIRPLINIDHHATNDRFGDLNLVDAESSSTGELVYKVIRKAGFSISGAAAENLFVAIMTDTGSFTYDNTTGAALAIAAQLVDQGVSPWSISNRIFHGYPASRLRLLEMALGTLEYHHGGELALMTITSEMFATTGADRTDCERFVEYPRHVKGVEIAALLRQTDHNDYRASLRSNRRVNVARLAGRFGGGGHFMAAGFESKGPLETVKAKLITEAACALNHERI
jgi:phosphoesterase RecJ-like protein